MIKNSEYQLGSIVQLKKPHPSGTTEWEVIRVGADIKISSQIEKTLFIMVPRTRFNRIVKKVIKY